MKECSEIIWKFIKKKDIDNKFELIILCKNWDKVLGPPISQMAKPVGSKKNTIIIGVEDSILMQELSFYSYDILQKINNFFGSQLFDKVKYKLLEDKTPLNIVINKNKRKTFKYNKLKIPNQIGKLEGTISKKSPVYKAYKSYINLISHIQTFKEEKYNGR